MGLSNKAKKLKSLRNQLKKVKGTDDAECAKWIPLNKILDISDQSFEDHASIIKYTVNKIG